MELKRGFRGKLSDYLDVSRTLDVAVTVDGSATYDCCCFGVDADEKLSDDAYMIFYNQTSSPNEEIVSDRNGANTVYKINLAKLPIKIQKLIFTVSIDGDGVMSEIGGLEVKIAQDSSVLQMRLDSGNFKNEKAIIAVELYRKDVWRIAAVASGFDGGLPALLKHFGGEEVLNAPPKPTRPPVPPPVSTPTKISLEKRLEKEAPQLAYLAEPLKVSLEKHKLNDVVAQVALLVDISGSMSHCFSYGTVQRVIDKVVPLAMQFDDNGEFELWFFGTNCRRSPSVTTKNYTTTTQNWQKIMSDCGGGTNLAPALEDVINQYKNDELPAFVLCITDGATAGEGRVKALISNAAEYPIFWQFIGLGNGNYGILEKLDNMKGRKVDNANFFALDDIDKIDNKELYSRMLTEFPAWLKEATRLGIIN